VDWVRNLVRLPDPGTSEGQQADRIRRRLDVVLPQPPIFDHVAREVFRFVRTMTVDDVVAMLGTYSGVIVASPQDRARKLAEARAALEERFPGSELIDVPMRASCWRADRIARAAES
jgi:hypothetical protein